MSKYFIIAGEASGDLHGAALIEQLKHRDPQAQCTGLGGDRMEAGLSESEERLFLRMDQVLAKEEENREAMKDMERRLKKTEDRLAKAEERLEKALKTESEKKTHASERWSALLRQATWLVGIACSAWIVITLINKLLP